jgi:hypothetical protein
MITDAAIAVAISPYRSFDAGSTRVERLRVITSRPTVPASPAL